MRVIDWDHPVIYLMFPWGMKITAPYFYDVKSDLWVGTFFIGIIFEVYRKNFIRSRGA